MGSPKPPRSVCRFSQSFGNEAPITAKMNRIQVFFLIAAGIVVAALVIVGLTGKNSPLDYAQTVTTFLYQIPSTLLWLLAALGIGGWAGTLLKRDEWNVLDRELLLFAIGIVSLIWLDTVFGSIGILKLPGASFFSLAILGLLGVWRIRGWTTPEPASKLANWTLAATVLPLAILLLAAISTPGWLWRTEFGGYDALSYHLQLPREWILLGGIVETPHNAYGYLPNGVEAAYMHLGLLTGGMWNAAESCQLLSASWTILAALITARVARRLAPNDSGAFTSALGAALLLATPWVIVVGSLAYNESAVILALAAMLLLLLGTHELNWRGGAVLGILAGGACLAKLSSGVLVILPLAVACLLLLKRGRWLSIGASAACAAFIVLFPWLLRNGIWTGNPVFPFLTSLFGTGNWSAEQIAIWNSAHRGEGDLVSRLPAIFNAYFREGIGPSPDPTEPWLPQWSVMPWLGAAGAVILLLRLKSERLRRAAVSLAVFVIVAIVAWILFTHAKARFLVPTAVPLAILTAAGAAHLLHSTKTRVILAVGAWFLALVPLGIYLGEGQGMPTWGIARNDAFRGEFEKEILAISESDEERRQILSNGSPGFYLNYLLPTNAQILLLGEAAPFHFRMHSEHGQRIAYSTVWSRGPLEKTLIESDDPQQWVQDLRDQGFTHIMINPSMLQRWQRSGWLAAELSTEKITSLTKQLKPMHRFNNGVVIFQVPPATPLKKSP